MNTLLDFEIDLDYGVMLDTSLLYISLSWESILLGILSVVGYKIYKVKTTKKGKK